MKISIAVCSYNPDLRLLDRVLEAATDDLAGAGIEGEMILIDNNSRPPLDGAALSNRAGVHLIREAKPGLTAARETAIGEAAGDIILFVDDDNVLGAGYVSAVVEEFDSDDRVGLFGGSVVPEYAEGGAEWLGDLRGMLAIRTYERDWRFVTEAPPYTECFPVGAGIAMRRELAEAWVEDCAVTSRIEGRSATALSSGEDLDMGLFALSRGYTLVVSGKATLTHVIPNARLERGYIARLAVESLNSTRELEAKWRPRLDAPIFPMLYEPIAQTLLKWAVASVSGIFSDRMRVRAAFFRALVCSRFRNLTGGS